MNQDPRYAPGGRFHYGSTADQVAELKAAGVTKNGDGPIVKGTTAKGKLKTQPGLAGMVEKVRQREGYLSASWRTAGPRRLRSAPYCTICGGVIAPHHPYFTGGQPKAHASCVRRWKRELE